MPQSSARTRQSSTSNARSQELERRNPPLQVPDPYGIVNFEKENLPIANFPRSSALSDCVHRRFHQLIVHYDLDFDLGQQVHAVFVTVIRFRVPFLPPVSAHL